MARAPISISCAPFKALKDGTGTPFNPATFLKTTAKGRVISAYKKKAIIFEQGDAADSVLYIKSGKVKVTVVSPEGNEAVVAILGEDEFLGEGCLIGQPKRLATASAMTDCKVMRVSKAEIQKTFKDEPAFPRCLSRIF